MRTLSPSFFVFRKRKINCDLRLFFVIFPFFSRAEKPNDRISSLPLSFWFFCPVPGTKGILNPAKFYGFPLFAVNFNPYGFSSPPCGIDQRGRLCPPFAFRIMLVIETLFPSIALLSDLFFSRFFPSTAAGQCSISFRFSHKDIKPANLPLSSTFLFTGLRYCLGLTL